MLAAARSKLCRSVSAWSGVFASIAGTTSKTTAVQLLVAAYISSLGVLYSHICVARVCAYKYAY